eukprot:762639-Hanusia_phi.AAC.6
MGEVPGVCWGQAGGVSREGEEDRSVKSRARGHEEGLGDPKPFLHLLPVPQVAVQVHPAVRPLRQKVRVRLPPAVRAPDQSPAGQHEGGQRLSGQGEASDSLQAPQLRAEGPIEELRVLAQRVLEPSGDGWGEQRLEWPLVLSLVRELCGVVPGGGAGVEDTPGQALLLPALLPPRRLLLVLRSADCSDREVGGGSDSLGPTRSVCDGR